MPGTRRQFIRRVAMGFGGYLAVSHLACKPHPHEEPKPEPAPHAQLPADGLKSLSAEQFALIAAACERILPRDEDPGATDLGCAIYIDKMMADPDAKALWGRAIFGGIPALEKQSRARFGKLFAEATIEQQEQLLGLWQHSKFTGEQAFFDVLHSLTLEGAFSDPSYGGNLGGRGFAMIGFAPPEPTPGHPLQLGK
jgi:gluconate 2-dehydrogenase gamma chain